ncbi:hypothetical protein IFM89_011014 [Coptis chinensis]|uniref:Uncharacterized protein n=1 Tax=Coptis chinensis TaxID=261450 RepID=A0A835IN70_9MAGN|nr:hypothetical protein IFM89_011014 [Coptis chinensis]
MDEVRRGLYADNDIEIRDLFCKVSSGGLKFTLGHHTSIGKILQGIRHSETRIGDSYLADVKTQLKCEISDNIHSRVFATMISEPIPGMKTIFNFIIPDCNFGKVGREDLSIGTNVSFNPATRKLTECKYGLRSTMPGYIFSCSLNTKNDIVTGSLYHLVRSSTCTALGYQFTSNISTFQSKLTVGIQHAMDPLTKVKGCVDNFGTGVFMTRGVIGGKWVVCRIAKKKPSVTDRVRGNTIAESYPMTAEKEWERRIKLAEQRYIAEPSKA